MVDRLTIARRLQKDGRWATAEGEKNDMIKLARAQGMDKAEAQKWAYAQIDRVYPPLPPPEPAADDSTSSTPQDAASGRVQGLGDLPADWPELPANASLQAEIGWVQSNRLATVEERPSGATRVHLDRAREPAPSRAALGWLETSIRSYAKYVDVVARSLAVVQDEQDQAKRERLAIKEIDELLAEAMAEAGTVRADCTNCPHRPSRGETMKSRRESAGQR